MNARERFLATMRFEKIDRPPMWEFGYWAGTVRRWYGEGLPKKTGVPEWLADGQSVRAEGAYWDATRPPDSDVHDYLGFDKGIRRLPLNIHLCPQFEPRVLEEHEDWFLWRDEDGIVKKDMKNKESLPHFVRGPVQNREDWERLKAERLRPTIDGRLPADWPELVRELNQRDYPLLIGGQQGFYGTPRYLLGEELVLTTFYDDPELMHDINNHLCEMWISIYSAVMKDVKPDVALIWEDMAYKTGPLISPALFREFLLPYYKRLTAFFKDNGVDIILVDCDGNIWKLLPLWIEGGVTGVYPFEVMAGMDVVEVRKAFPSLQILGGIDKTQLALGKAEIDAELEAKLPFMLQHGGYIPFVDHVVPPDIPWENFVYYRRRVAEMAERYNNM